MKFKGLSQLDAEGVILLSSPYRGTAESKSATKKSHKMRESVDFSTDFDILISKTIFFSIILYLSLKVAFVLR